MKRANQTSSLVKLFVALFIAISIPVTAYVVRSKSGSAEPVKAQTIIEQKVYAKVTDSKPIWTPPPPYVYAAVRTYNKATGKWPDCFRLGIINKQTLTEKTGVCPIYATNDVIQFRIESWTYDANNNVIPYANGPIVSSNVPQPLISVYLQIPTPTPTPTPTLAVKCSTVPTCKSTSDTVCSTWCGSCKKLAGYCQAAGKQCICTGSQ